MTKKRKKQRKNRVWPAFLLLGLLGALMVFIINIRASGGELNAQGLRVSGEGRSDASHVMPPEFFEQPRVREAYAIAQEIPATLNQLYCWCGCVPRIHRSALECFESQHAANCDICLANAEVAWEMTQEGVTDPAAIQKKLDERFGRGI
ncbi:MAG: PCYCGC motif-containing (lipo)protein [Longimicrobiaceae bacterium]